MYLTLYRPVTPSEILSSHISHCVVVCYNLKFVKFRGFVLVFLGLCHTNSQYSGYQFLVYIHVTANLNLLVISHSF